MYSSLRRVLRDPMMDFTSRLKQLRLDKGQSLQEVADAVFASKAHIWEIENGRSRNPSIELLSRLAGHFGLSVSALIGENVEPDDDEALVFYQSIRRLPKGDREVLKAVIDGMKARADAATQ